MRIIFGYFIMNFFKTLKKLFCCCFLRAENETLSQISDENNLSDETVVLYIPNEIEQTNNNISFLKRTKSEIDCLKDIEIDLNQNYIADLKNFKSSDLLTIPEEETLVL